jgi:hypothetical protein
VVVVLPFLDKEGKDDVLDFDVAVAKLAPFSSWAAASLDPIDDNGGDGGGMVLRLFLWWFLFFVLILSITETETDGSVS